MGAKASLGQLVWGHERRLFEFHPRVGVLAVADGARRDLARLGEGRLLEHLPLASHVHVSLAARAYAMHQRRGRSLLRADEALPPCGLAVVADHIDRRTRHREPQGWAGSPLHRTVSGGAGVTARAAKSLKFGEPVTNTAPGGNPSRDSHSNQVKKKELLTHVPLPVHPADDPNPNHNQP